MTKPIWVIHVLESMDPTVWVYSMGPKPVDHEYVDGVLVTPLPLTMPYDGLVQQGPTADFNYDITQFAFHRRGTHTIEWRGGGAGIEDLRGLRSNVITVMIVP